MTTDPQTAVDFDGCNRKCRLAGAHTLAWGACEHATQPEPTVSLSRRYTAADGFPAIGFDAYTVQELGELITAGVRASDLPVNGDDLVDVGLVAAHAIFNRNAAAPAAAVPVAAPPTTEQTALREQIAETLWAAAEHHTVAEWICCDPIDPTHALCVQGGKALEMLRALIVDDPDAWKPAPLPDAVLAVLPAPADRAAVARVRALHQEYAFGDDPQVYCAHCNQISGGWIPWPCPTVQALAAEAPHAETRDDEGLPARLEAALTERFTELGNPFSEMRRHEQGPDGWPASRPVGPRQIAEVLRELLAATAPAVAAQPGKEHGRG